MSAPTAALQALRASTSDFVLGLENLRWSDADAAAPSRCPGWTRGHVLTHVARNADGITATLAGALRREIVERYPGGRRDRDIEAGAGRPVTELRADVAESAERLDRVLGAIGDADLWDAETAEHQQAREWVARRIREVEIHRVDLDGGYTPDQWPPFLIELLLPTLADGVETRVRRPVRLHVASAGSVVSALAGRTWTSGPDAGDPHTTGADELDAPDWALLAWLTGRADAAGDVLATAPPIDPW